MNFTFYSMPRDAHLHFAGVSSSEITYVSKYDLTEMTTEEFLEFKRLMTEVSHIPGTSVLYDPEHQRWRFAWTRPCITTMDTNRLEYPDEA